MTRAALLLTLMVTACKPSVLVLPDAGRRQPEAGADTRFFTPDDAWADTPLVDDGPGPRDQGAVDSRVDGPVVDPCAGITCSGHGECVPVAGEPSCECELYYKADGLSCVPACTGVDCPEGQTCIPGHHQTTDPLCVDICDCSNCGNCDAGDIPSYCVAYCGNPDGSPATMACTKPCPNGGACIPFATPICWPGQGCISL